MNTLLLVLIYILIGFIFTLILLLWCVPDVRVENINWISVLLCFLFWPITVILVGCLSTFAVIQKFRGKSF